MGTVTRCHVNPKINETFKTSEDRSTEILNKLSSRSSSSYSFQVSRPTRWQLPKLQGSHIRFGNDTATQEFVIYMRLDRSIDVLKALRPYYMSGSKIEISVCLKYNGDELCRRLIQLESISNLDMKIRLRCSPKNLTEFLNNLSSKVQVFVAEEPENNSKVVLESDDIVYVSLNHTVATLSICKVTDTSRDPTSVHHVSCYVFLDQSPGILGSSKHSRDICTECSEGSHLMKVFSAVKHSSETIDLTRPQKEAQETEIDPLDTNISVNFDDDVYMEATDLRIKKPTATEVATGIVETAPENSLPIPEHNTTESKIKLDDSSSDVGIQASENSLNATLPEEEKKLRKVLTQKPIHRKHRGFPLEKFLMLKVKRMQQRLFDLQKELAVKERKDSNNDSDSLAEAEVPSSVDPQSGPLTVVYFGNDGSTAIVPSVSPNPTEMKLSETSIALVPAADTNDADRPFKCPMEGCNQRFNNKSSVSRHKKRVHFPHKLPKCYNCEHVFPRPYMLQRHLDHKVCFPK